jgi:hypothetical protein
MALKGDGTADERMSEKGNCIVDIATPRFVS